MHEDLKSYLVSRYLSEYEDEITHHIRSAKIAITFAESISGLNPKVVERAKKCTARVTKVDSERGFWVFKVNSAGSPNTHTVRVSFKRKGNITDVNKLDVKVSCTCEHWQWWGPDYNSKQDSYLFGQQTSNGAAPNVRDPNRINRVCKHVMAAAELFRNYRLKR